jgi:hypothetical protein
MGFDPTGEVWGALVRLTLGRQILRRKGSFVYCHNPMDYRKFWAAVRGEKPAIIPPLPLEMKPEYEAFWAECCADAGEGNCPKMKRIDELLTIKMGPSGLVYNAERSDMWSAMGTKVLMWGLEEEEEDPKK